MQQVSGLLALLPMAPFAGFECSGFGLLRFPVASSGYLDLHWTVSLADYYRRAAAQLARFDPVEWCCYRVGMVGGAGPVPLPFLLVQPVRHWWWVACLAEVWVDAPCGCRQGVTSMSPVRPTECCLRRSSGCPAFLGRRILGVVQARPSVEFVRVLAV